MGHTVDDDWQIEDSGERELWKRSRRRRDSLELGAEGNDGPSQRACTAASEEQSASAGHHALAVTDHARTSESQ